MYVCRDWLIQQGKEELDRHCKDPLLVRCHRIKATVGGSFEISSPPAFFFMGSPLQSRLTSDGGVL